MDVSRPASKRLDSGSQKIVTSKFLQSPSTDKFISRGSKFGGRLPFRGISQLLNWKDVKGFLKKRFLPSLYDYSLEDAAAYLKLFKSTDPGEVGIITSKDFTLSDQIDTMPIYREVEDLIRNKRISGFFHKLFMLYWRIQLCKETGKLMSAWLYEYHQPSNSDSFYKCSERMVQDRNIILHNSDFPFLIILVMVDDNIHLFEYNKEDMSLKFIHFVKEITPFSDEKDNFSKKMFRHFSNINITLFDDEIEIEQKEYKEEKYSINALYSAHKYIVMKYLNAPENITSAMDYFFIWLVSKLKIWVVGRPMSPVGVLSVPQSPAKYQHTNSGHHGKQPFKVKRIDPSPSEGSSPERSVSLPKSKYDSSIKDRHHVAKHGQIPYEDELKIMTKHKSKKIILEPQSKYASTHEHPKYRKYSESEAKHLVTPSPKKKAAKKSHNTSAETVKTSTITPEEQYQDVRRLLWFYFYHDKQRYKQFIKKCTEKKDPEMIKILGIDRLEATKNLFPLKLAAAEAQNKQLSQPAALFPKRHKDSSGEDFKHQVVASSLPTIKPTRENSPSRDSNEDTNSGSKKHYLPNTSPKLSKASSSRNNPNLKAIQLNKEKHSKSHRDELGGELPYLISSSYSPHKGIKRNSKSMVQHRPERQFFLPETSVEKHEGKTKPKHREK